MSTWFLVRWIDGSRTPRGALAVALAHGDGGERITQLTQAARSATLPQGLRMRLDTPLARPEQALVRPVSDYLDASDHVDAARLVRHLERLSRDKPLHAYRVRTSVVSGEDLVGREEVLEQLHRHLAHSSCHLRAPRRYGKTSLLRRLDAELPLSLRMDLSHHVSTGALVGALLYEVRARPRVDSLLRAAPSLAGWPPSGSSPEVLAEAEARLLPTHAQRLTALLLELLDALAQGGVVLILDEFSTFLRAALRHDREQIRLFLDQLQALRTRPQHPLRLVVAGSSGLSSYMAYLNLASSLADLQPLDLPPLPEAAARVLAQELLYGAGLRFLPETIDGLLSFVHPPVPYFLHALVGQLIDEVAERREVRPEDVEHAYRGRLLASAGAEFFKPFRVEDRPYPDAHKGAARALLVVLAHAEEAVELATLRQGTGLGRDELITLLSCLEEDYDLEHHSGRWSMRNRVLADRWRVHSRRTTGGM